MMKNIIKNFDFWSTVVLRTLLVRSVYKELHADRETGC